VVGTYRLLRQPLAEEYGGFYTSGEFDIGGLIARHDNLQFLELGRSCVLAAPIATRAPSNCCGTASTATWLQKPHRRDDRLRQSRRHRAQAARAATVIPASLWRRAPGSLARPRAPAGTLCRDEIACRRKRSIPRQALKVLPPLVKGYLRLGAYIGDGAGGSTTNSAPPMC